ncbi:hypothetical protein VTL71DRAFT_9497 [Oculimacula yallundae]|uniref:Aminoglycoside phosphotransferase domain-containing protein n=1 Tax=Oculimacula yallundae TaxID=86028 RepID=A0ABR4BTN5_9HELO
MMDANTDTEAETETDTDTDTYIEDDWPKMPDGTDFDGKQLLSLVRNGNSPFHGAWDINLLFREIQENLGGAQIVDVPVVSKGSNNYGFHLKLLNGLDIVARLARGDMNVPNYDGFPASVQISKAKFEVAVYELLRTEPGISASCLLYSRIPVQHPGPRLDVPKDISGRRLFIFRRADGENNVWRELSPDAKDCLLTQSARIRASLFNFNLPLDFSTLWLRERLFEQKPKSFPVSVSSTREFCVALVASKIEATIGNIGDMIGWEDDNNTVGPIAAAAKQSLLRLIPYIFPIDSQTLYRLVLEHGDFGIHNMSITKDPNRPIVTSVYDWETGCIVPAILSDPLMAVAVDLVTDEKAAPSVTRVSPDATLDDRAHYMIWARQYFQTLFSEAPGYEYAIQAGKDARYLWFALREWRGSDPEGYFGVLGAWAERRIEELGVE